MKLLNNPCIRPFDHFYDTCIHTIIYGHSNASTLQIRKKYKGCCLTHMFEKNKAQ